MGIRYEEDLGPDVCLFLQRIARGHEVSAQKCTGASGHCVQHVP